MSPEVPTPEEVIRGYDNMIAILQEMILELEEKRRLLCLTSAT